ncbi:MAG: M23 family metallopeptidase [Dermatophilaceae bacterium]|nr:M23 family metallopeptidase [Dermatophilaceae bacterium]
MRLLLPVAVAALIAATAVTASALPGSALPATAMPAGARSVAAAIVPTADARRPPNNPAPVIGAGSVAYAPSVQAREVLAWPLSPRPAIRRRFEQPRDRWSRGHRGVDLLASVGQPVLSAAEGVVAFSGVIAGRGVITVRHAAGLRTTYEPVDGRLTAGARVHRGNPIGVISPTAGHCLPATCLHWGAISAATYRDPLLLLGVGRPILLPLG